MKLYCFVQDGAVINGPAILSVSLANKSDFELLDLGWYYAECIRSATFVDRTEVFLPVQFDIQPTKVICTYTKRDKTQAELDAQNAEKQVEVEADKADRLAFAATFMASEEYAALPEALQMEWVGYVSIVENTQTEGLGNAVWDVAFPSVPPTSEPSPELVIVDA
jgi:hypothetical protein